MENASDPWGPSQADSMKALSLKQRQGMGLEMKAPSGGS